jgi:regulator of protease activity HflC (stomatin/prohibitin superfamily)
MGSTISDRLGGMQFEHDPATAQRFRRIATGVVALIAVLILLPSTFTYVNPGYVGIVIHRAGGGVDPVPLGPGIHARLPFVTGIVEYPIYLKTIVLARNPTEGSPLNDEINVNSVEGQPLSLDVSLSFQLDASQTPKLYTTFRTDIDQITHGFVKQTVRQALQEAQEGGSDDARAPAHLGEAVVDGVRREAVHDQRAARAAGGDGGDQPEERDAAAGAHRPE